MLMHNSVVYYICVTLFGFLCIVVLFLLVLLFSLIVSVFSCLVILWCYVCFGWFFLDCWFGLLFVLVYIMCGIYWLFI